ncbi:helix-turn-helix domain-containing protein [Streptomyces sp. NPDC060194]|uniref:helix-turn-helix domain-containing protein n=1 Tax=Streptomyces sp. NPDC060194 TaxID=3347069 RepID=UPI00364DE1B4
MPQHPRDPESSPRALLGAELRHMREQAGYSQEALGELLFVSGSYVGQMEAGTRRIRADMAARIDELLLTGGLFSRNCRAANASKYPAHFAEAAEAEAVATEIREYNPLLIPGLLQTSAYARAVFRAYRPTASEQTIDDLVAARLDRAQLLGSPTKPLLWPILDEAVLRRSVGGPAVMAEALRHVISLACENRIIVQVIAFSAGAHAANSGSLKLMYFDDAPPLAYLQGQDTGLLEDDPSTVSRHRLTYDLLVASALSPQDSMDLISSTAEDYAHEASEHP